MVTVHIFLLKTRINQNIGLFSPNWRVVWSLTRKYKIKWVHIILSVFFMYHSPVYPAVHLVRGAYGVIWGFDPLLSQWTELRFCFSNFLSFVRSSFLDHRRLSLKTFWSMSDAVIWLKLGHNIRLVYFVVDYQFIYYKSYRCISSTSKLG